MDELPTPKSKSTIKNKTTDISELLGKTNTPQKKDTSEIEKLILEEIRKR